MEDQRDTAPARIVTDTPTWMYRRILKRGLGRVERVVEDNLGPGIDEGLTRRCRVAILDEVHPTNLDRVHPDGPRDAVHVTLDGEHGLRCTEAPEGAFWRCMSGH